VANALDVNEASFQEEVLEASQPVLVDFWAPWCGYCQRLLPIIDELADETADKMKIVKINVDENRAVAQKYGVMSLPTLVLFKNGEQLEKLLGFMPKANILAKIEPKL
jgi:thioredoxin 1